MDVPRRGRSGVAEVSEVLLNQSVTISRLACWLFDGNVQSQQAGRGLMAAQPWLGLHLVHPTSGGCLIQTRAAE